jgi:AcrR family transcriptional regulator
VTIDGRLARGARTRTAVLDAAVALATAHGLDGLSLGQLAEHLAVSKSGLFAHWRSKEELQLAAIEHAKSQWTAKVISPGLAAPRGVRRLFAMHQARIDFYAGPDALPGACFFANAEFEYSTRPGPVRGRLVEACREWLGLLERLAAEAIDSGDLHSTVDPQQLAYEIEAHGVAAVYQSRLIGDTPAVYARARRAVLERLRPLCTNPTLLPEALP